MSHTSSYKDSTSSLPEPPKIDSGRKSNVPAALSQPTVPESIIDGVDLSYLSPVERDQIISVMKAAQSEETKIIPPAPSSSVSVTAPMPAVPVNGSLILICLRFYLVIKHLNNIFHSFDCLSTQHLIDCLLIN